MERKAFTNLMEASARVLLGETHMIGKTVIVKGKKGKVVKQVSSAVSYTHLTLPTIYSV